MGFRCSLCEDPAKRPAVVAAGTDRPNTTAVDAEEPAATAEVTVAFGVMAQAEKMAGATIVTALAKAHVSAEEALAR